MAWGDSEAAGWDPGIKKSASVNLSSGGFGCSRFSAYLTSPDRADINDSGSPIFVTGGNDPIVGGTVYGADSSFRNLSIAATAQSANQLEAIAGLDPNRPSCGDISPVGDAGTDVVAFSATLDGAVQQQTHSFSVGANKALLRVGLNSRFGTSFSVYVKAGSPPTTSNYDCKDGGSLELGFCEIANPTQGT